MESTEIMRSYYGDYHGGIQSNQLHHDHQIQQKIKFAYHHSYASDVGFSNQVQYLFYLHYNFALFHCEYWRHTQLNYRAGCWVVV